MDPQKKKKESLRHDRRNSYGENDKSSRKGVRRRKQSVNQTHRHAVKQSLASPDPEEAQERVSQVRRPHWRKVPDLPLGDVLRGDLHREIGAALSAGRSEPSLLPRLECGLLAAGWAPQAVRALLKQLRSAAILGYGRLDLGLGLAELREVLALLTGLWSGPDAGGRTP